MATYKAVISILEAIVERTHNLDPAKRILYPISQPQSYQRFCNQVPWEANPLDFCQGLYREAQYVP